MIEQVVPATGQSEFCVQLVPLWLHTPGTKQSAVVVQASPAGAEQVPGASGQSAATWQTDPVTLHCPAARQSLLDTHDCPSALHAPAIVGQSAPL